MMMMQAEVWRFVGFASSVVGLLCYAFSSSFNYLFGDWSFLSIALYSVLSFIICGTILFAKKCQHSTSLLLKAHLAVLVLTLTSVYSFFHDKAVNQSKPDALSLISCAAFALMSFSLSIQTHTGFEVDLLYFFLGYLIVQLMKIHLLFALPGAGFSYSLIIFRSYLDSQMETETVEPQDYVVIQIDGPFSQILKDCAQALQQNNLNLARTIMKEVGKRVSSQAEAMTKVESYLADALIRRIHGIYSQEPLDSSFSDKLYLYFYDSCPYIRFAHLTANQAILDAFASANRVHVIDLGLKQVMQWQMLMHALASRPGGPPKFRLTGIGAPQPDKTDALQFVGWKLAKYAETIGVEFEFRGIECKSLADLDPSVLEIRPTEASAVNSVFELHRTLARSGDIEKVLDTIKAIEPKIVTMVEQEANHNGQALMERFTEALHYYSNVFDLIVPEGSHGLCHELAMSEVYLGREICNVVGCEGKNRVERHETLSQWKGRMVSAGFEPVHLGSNAMKQANMLSAFAGDGYRVEDDNGCLLLGSHARHLIATSAWKIPASQSGELHSRIR